MAGLLAERSVCEIADNKESVFNHTKRSFTPKLSKSGAPGIILLKK